MRESTTPDGPGEEVGGVGPEEFGDDGDGLVLFLWGGFKVEWGKAAAELPGDEVVGANLVGGGLDFDGAQAVGGSFDGPNRLGPSRAATTLSRNSENLLNKLATPELVADLPVIVAAGALAR